MVASSATGKTWSAPEPVDNGMSAGHQVMPSIAFAGGRLVVAYHDFREGVSQLFRPWIEETSVHMLATKRHTVDVRAAQANRAPIRGAMRRCGCPSTCGAAVPGVGPRPVEQLQFNPPNLKVFELGTVPFFGDYIDLAPSPAFVPVAGGWT